MITTETARQRALTLEESLALEQAMRLMEDDKR